MVFQHDTQQARNLLDDWAQQNRTKAEKENGKCFDRCIIHIAEIHFELALPMCVCFLWMYINNTKRQVALLVPQGSFVVLAT